MIVPQSEEQSSAKSSHRDEELPSPEQCPPPYSSLPQGSSTGRPTQSPNFPPDLAPANYLHVKEKNSAVERKILLDLNLPRPPPSALPVVAKGEVIPHLTLGSYNGAVSGEVWVLRANHEGPTTSSHGGQKPARPRRERARLHFFSHNGAVKALVHLHPSTVEPRPFLSVDAMAYNGSVTITIPRSFHGQLTLHTDNGHVTLSSALVPRAAAVSTPDGTHTYFVGERPSSGKWHTGESEDGDEVDEVRGWSKNGSVKVLYDDEGGTRILSSLFKALGL